MNEELEGTPLLHLQGRDDRQDAGDEAATGLGVRPEALLAPDHRPAETSLRQVIRRRHPIDVHEGPHARLGLQQLGALPPGLRRWCALLGRHEQSVNTAPLVGQTLVTGLSVDLAITMHPPGGHHPLGSSHQPKAVPLAAEPIRHRLEVAL